VPSAARVTKRPSAVATKTGAGQQSSPSQSIRTTRSDGRAIRNALGARRPAGDAATGDDVTLAVFVAAGSGMALEVCPGELPSREQALRTSTSTAADAVDAQRSQRIIEGLYADLQGPTVKPGPFDS